MEKNGVTFDNEEDKLLGDLEQLEIQFGLLEIQLSTVKSKDRDEIERLGSQETEYFEKIYQIKRKLLMMRQVARLKGTLRILTFKKKNPNLSRDIHAYTTILISRHQRQ
jgi:hypothetical protein